MGGEQSAFQDEMQNGTNPSTNRGTSIFNSQNADKFTTIALCCVGVLEIGMKRGEIEGAKGMKMKKEPVDFIQRGFLILADSNKKVIEKK